MRCGDGQAEALPGSSRSGITTLYETGFVSGNSFTSRGDVSYVTLRSEDIILK
jgi:hypothetical protein